MSYIDTFSSNFLVMWTYLDLQSNSTKVLSISFSAYASVLNYVAQLLVVKVKHRYKHC